MSDQFIASLPQTMRGWFLFNGFRLIGTPYIFSGQDPFRDGGLDCSGYIGYCGVNCGLLPEGFDETAAGYYAKFARLGKSLQAPAINPGALVFFSRTNNVADIKHVGIIVGPGLMLDAGRGDSSLERAPDETIESVVARAKKKGACVSMRPIDHHDMRFRFYCDPFLGLD